jgi:hypothetical protein
MLICILSLNLYFSFNKISQRFLLLILVMSLQYKIPILSDERMRIILIKFKGDVIIKTKRQ